MTCSPLAKVLPELIDQLLSAESISARQELVEQTGEICNRDVIAGISDAVNRIAREDLPRAERLAEVACWLTEQSDDLFCRARIRRAAGNLQVLRGKYADAIQTFQTCIKQFAAIGEEIEVAATLSGSLLPLIYLGQYSEALERARQARDIAEHHGDTLLLARLDINVGNILHRQDRFPEAILHYERALVMLDRLGQKRDCVIAWVNLAVCHTALNDFLRAEEAYKKARTLALLENMPSIVAEADYNVAYLYYRRGDYTQAIQLYQQTRQYCHRVADQFLSALCDLDQAEMYLDLHLNREGTQLAQEAVAAFESMDLGYEAAKGLVWLGIGAHQNRNAFLALDFFAKAQERMRSQQNVIWVALLDFYQAVVLHQEGRFNEALRSSIAAHDFFSSFPNSGKAAQVQLLRANLHLALNELSNAEDSCASAIQVASRLKSPFLLTQGYAIRGQIEQFRGSIDDAINWFNEALQWLERSPIRPQGEESKLSLSMNRLEPYEALVSLMVSRSSSEHTPEAILAVVEKAKSRELAELLASRANIVPASRNCSSLVEQVRSLRNELNWYYGQIDTAETRTMDNSVPQVLEMRSRIQELEEGLTKTLSEIRPADEQFYVLQSAGTIPLNKIRGMIRQDEMILEFYEARGLLYACLCRKDSVHIVPTAQSETIRDMLHSLRSHFTKFDRGNDRSALLRVSLLEGVQSVLFALYRELIHPIRKHINGHRLIIVPHGPLNYLPFHALFNGSRYLIEDHVISYAASASQYYLSSCKEAHFWKRDLVFRSRGFDQQHALHAQIEKVLPDARTFLGETAGIDVLEQYGPEARFIHVDTRLQLRQDNPLFSTFMIGSAAISILDTYNLRLPCSLVGLSGTGSGIDSAGNGNAMNALSQGLEYAGAQTLLMPLWNITGEPLVQFLENFYSRVSCEDDKPLAFQQTLADIREKFCHPYYWASFVLRGKTGREWSKSSCSTDDLL
jgi:CHAT domain-containing protein/tetratricopeptide (TPR) repeat protein